MKIGAYVPSSFNKRAFKVDYFDKRQFFGLKIIIDALNRAGYVVDYAGVDTIHEYDVILVSITATMDWYSFIKERMRWRRGNYKVVVGGNGVSNVIG